MRRAIEETRRRRELQEEYNTTHGITPETVRKNIRHGIEAEAAAHEQANAAAGLRDAESAISAEYISQLEAEMMAAADALEFERAAEIRNRISSLREAKSGKQTTSGQDAKGDSSQGRRSRRTSRGRLPRPKRG